MVFDGGSVSCFVILLAKFKPITRAGEAEAPLVTKLGLCEKITTV